MKETNEMAPEVPKSVLDQWDQMVAAMQMPQQEAAIQKLFRASPKELGDVAVRAAKKLMA
jgi:hypothetical protein